MKWKSKRMAVFSLPWISEKIGHCSILQDLDIIRNSRCNRENPLLLLWSWVPVGYCHKEILPRVPKFLKTYLLLVFIPSVSNFILASILTFHQSLYSTVASLMIPFNSCQVMFNLSAETPVILFNPPDTQETPLWCSLAHLSSAVSILGSSGYWLWLF